MEEKETLLFEVIVDIPKVQQNAELARVAIAQLRKEKQITDAEFKKGEITTEQYAKSLGSIDTQLVRSQGNLRGYQKILSDNDKIQRLATGSANQMRAQLSTLTTAYDNLSSSERENENVGGKLESRIKALSAELLELEKNTGRNQRNVGNYSGAIEPLIQQLVKLQEQQKLVSQGGPEFEQYERRIIGFQQQISQAGAQSGKTFDEVKDKVSSYGESVRDATAKLVQLEDQQEQLAKTGGDAYEKLGFEVAKVKREINDVPSESKGVVGLLETLDETTGAFGGRIGELQGYLGKGKTALEAVKGSLTGVKGAIAGTGIGLLILALGTLVGWLTKTQAGADFLARQTKALSTVFDVTLGRAIEFGKSLIKIFTDPKQALADLYNNIKSLPGALLDAAKAGNQIAAESQRIRDAERDINLERAKSRAAIERLKFIAEDASKSQAIRAKAAKDAFDLENRTLTKSLDLQRARIVNLEREAGYGTKLFKDTEELAEARLKLYELEEDSVGRQTELNNNLNSIKQEAADKAKQAAADALEREKYRLQQLTAVAKLELLIAQQKGEDTLKLQEKLVQREAAVERAGLKKGSDDRRLLEAETNAKILELRVNHAVDVQSRVNRITQSGIDSSLALVRAGTEAELKLTVERIRKQAQAEQIEIERRLAGVKNKVEREVELGRVAVQSQKAIDDARRTYAESEANRQSSLDEDRLATAENLNQQGLIGLRDIADKRIDLEEETQIKLLDIQKQYGAISDEAYLVRLNAIQSRAIAARKLSEQEIAQIGIDNQKARAESQLALSREGSKAELDARINAINAERASALNVANLTADQIRAINDKANRDIADLNRDYTKKRIEQVLDVASQATQALSGIFEAQSQAQKDTLDGQQKAALNSAGLNADARAKIEERFQKRKEAAEKSAAERRRKIASIEAIINTAGSVVKASPNVFLMALAAATGLAQLAIINAQKFAKGGLPTYESDHKGSYVVGPGTGTSDSIPAMISNGESVINARSTSMFYKELSDINVRGGGRAFPGVSPGQTYQQTNFSRLALGGVATSIAASSSYDDARTIRLITAAISAMPNPVVGVKQFTTVQDKAVQVAREADS